MYKLLKNRKLLSAAIVVILISLKVFPLNHRPMELELPLPDIIIYEDNDTITATVQKPQCPDVAKGMMKGRWKSRKLSSKEETEIELFLESARTEHGMPRSMQRTDGMCGNIDYENLFWFRALCNPKGSTPCCRGGKCVASTSEQCRCNDCYDLRIPIHAEYSTWIPEDSRCEVKNFTTSEACKLLYKTQLFMIGDSLMRQVYIALLLILNNDRDQGAYRSHMPKEVQKRCKGMYAFTEKSCRKYVMYGTRVCGDTVAVSNREHYDIAHVRNFHKLAKALLHVKNTVILVGIGVHESFDFRVYEEYILPVILMVKKENAVWPRVIWFTNHHFGLLKTPLKEKQENIYAERFNKFMTGKLRQHNIPIFDTYNMTCGVMSQDGVHFGIGVNLMKAQMLLNFLQELRYKEGW